MRKTKIVLLLLIYFSAHNFFNPFGIISEQIGKAAFYASSFLGLVLVMLNGKKIKQAKPLKYYWWIVCSIVISMFSVWLNYNQPLLVSIMTTLPYFFAYLYFFILEKFTIEKEFFIKTIKVLTVCSLVMYVINLVTFPSVVFGVGKEEYDMSRGFVRLGVPMIEIVVMWLFYSVNQWILSGKKKWLLWIGTTGFLVVMSLTRQVIIMSFALSFLMIMQRAKMWKKVVVVGSVAFFTAFILPEIPIYKSMMELSEEQAYSNKYKEEDIRITAWRFYTLENQANLSTSIVGNGIPSIGNSKYGDAFERKIYPIYGGNACFYVDVGWAGFYWLFGIFGVIGLLNMIVRSIRKSFNERKLYLAYWFLFILVTSVASAPIIFHAQVVSLCIAFYLIYGKDYEENNRIYSIGHS